MAPIPEEIFARLTDDWPQWQINAARRVLAGEQVVWPSARIVGRREAKRRLAAFYEALLDLGLVEAVKAPEGLQGSSAAMVWVDEAIDWRGDAQEATD